LSCLFLVQGIEQPVIHVHMTNKAAEISIFDGDFVEELAAREFGN
jgi:hypothetical protein